MTLHKVSICYGMYKWGRAPRRRYHCMAVSLRGPAVAAGRPRAGGAAGARRDRVRGVAPRCEPVAGPGAAAAVPTAGHSCSARE